MSAVLKHIKQIRSKSKKGAYNSVIETEIKLSAIGG